MKKLLLTTILALTIFGASAQNSFNVFNAITDPLFREYCQRFDTNNDGILSLSEANAVLYMDIWYDGYSPKVVRKLNEQGVETSKFDYAYIKSLDGIEYFPNILVLKFCGSSVSSIDLSKNVMLQELNCSENNLTELNLKNNTALIKLECSANKIEKLDLSNNLWLTDIDCCGNLLSEIEVAHLRSLRSLILCYNSLVEIDVTNNKLLTTLDCSSNRLTALDITSNAEMMKLYCNKNRLRSLDLSNNNQMYHLYCHSNPTLSSIYMWRSFNFDKPASSLSYYGKDSGSYFKLKP